MISAWKRLKRGKERIAVLSRAAGEGFAKPDGAERGPGGSVFSQVDPGKVVRSTPAGSPAGRGEQGDGQGGGGGAGGGVPHPLAPPKPLASPLRVLCLVPHVGTGPSACHAPEQSETRPVSRTCPQSPERSVLRKTAPKVVESGRILALF